MTHPISVALLGIGGYGNTNVGQLLEAQQQDEADGGGGGGAGGCAGIRIAGAIDPSPSSCRRLAELQARDVPLFESWQEFYASRGADLLIISTPIHLHARHVTAALDHGSHVMCEKPLCVTPDEIRTMLLSRDRARKQVAIGYQWSFSPAIQDLKADIRAGAFGRPKRLKSMVLWPRDEAYYHRNRWAGLLRDPRGNWVLDSPVNNACAHHLHNMFYVLGRHTDQSAVPQRVTAELYRAHPIENYDTAALRCMTDDGVEIVFIVSHATDVSRGPVFSYEFERAVVEVGAGPEDHVIARFTDGTDRRKDYGSPNAGKGHKIRETIASIRSGTPVVCGIEAAASHTRCMWAAQKSMDQIVPFSESLLRISGEEGSRQTFVDGLTDGLQRCYDGWTLPSEAGLTWARAGRAVNVDDACA
jgi:predicted dehydrogenase